MRARLAAGELTGIEEPHQILTRDLEQVGRLLCGQFLLRGNQRDRTSLGHTVRGLGEQQQQVLRERVMLPIGRPFGLVPLSPFLFGVCLAITAGYTGVSEAAKRWFFRRVTGEALAPVAVQTTGRA